MHAFWTAFSNLISPLVALSVLGVVQTMLSMECNYQPIKPVGNTLAKLACSPSHDGAMLAAVQIGSCANRVGLRGQACSPAAAREAMPT